MQCRVIFKMQRTVVQCVLEFPQVGKCDLQYFTDNLQLQPFHQEQEDFPCQPIGKWHIRRPEPGQVAMSSVKLVAGMDKADVIHAVKMTPVLILSAGLHGCRFDCLCAKPSALLRHLGAVWRVTQRWRVLDVSSTLNWFARHGACTPAASPKYSAISGDWDVCMRQLSI